MFIDAPVSPSKSIAMIQFLDNCPQEALYVVLEGGEIIYFLN